MKFDRTGVEQVLGTTPGLLDGTEMTFNDDPAQSDRYLAEAEVLVVSNPVDLSNLKARAPLLKWVQVMSAGAEAVVQHVPADVALTNVRGAHSDRAGEFGITAILMLNNRIPALATAQRAHRWAPSPQSVVTGKTVAILGLGALGGATAKWAQVFGLHVVGITRSAKPHEHADEVVTMDRMAEVFGRSDFVDITLPLTPETKGIVSRQMLDCLPPHAGVVNIGRGPVMDHDALADKLREGSLSGAVLDVFPTEPLPEGSDLWDVPTLFVTPHTGLDDPGDFGVKCLQVFARNLAAHVAGRPLETPVDKSLGY